MASKPSSTSWTSGRMVSKTWPCSEKEPKTASKLYVWRCCRLDEPRMRVTSLRDELAVTTGSVSFACSLLFIGRRRTATCTEAVRSSILKVRKKSGLLCDSKGRAERTVAVTKLLK